MEQASNRFRGFAGVLIAAVFMLGATLALQASAQDGEEAAAAGAASSAEQPRSRRERRRAAEAAEAEAKAAAAETPAGAEVAALPVTAIVAEEEQEEELVCKMYRQTGTKIGKRVCGTQAEWDAWADRTSQEAKDVVREISQRSQFPAAPEVPAAFPTP